MAQVIVSFGKAPILGVSGHAQVFTAKNHKVEEIASAAASAATAIAASADDVAQIVNNGPEDIWVTFGPAATAAVGSGHFVMNGTVREFGGLSSGDLAAVINDA